MYYDFEVEIPTEKGKVSKRTRGNSIFVEYKEKEQYDNNKGYSVAKRVTIGKVSDSNKNTMYPNEVYFDMFCPDEKPESVTNENRNMALGFGMYAVLDSIFEELKIPQILKKTIDPNHKPELILDLIAYSIITENNASIYYPDYAEGHVLFSKDMHIYYESTVGRVLKSITNDERQDFFEEWNKLRKKENTEETIYISYDSTNKNIQDSNIELSECENEKINISERVINYAIAYDGSNEIPLFYEVYPGDTVQIKELVARAHKFGYNNISFILDRGYISKSNINEMDDNGFDFMIFINTLNNEIKNLYLENKNRL